MFVTVDPGLGGTGYAVFSSESSVLLPILTGVVSPLTNQEKLWPQRQTEVMEKLFPILINNYFVKGKWQITKAYIELPTMFMTPKGMACATGQNGADSSLVKLAVLVGRLYEMFDSESIPVELIAVNEWKGTLPKKAVSARIQERLHLSCSGIAKFGDHACDAVGMGLYVKKVFKANTGDKNERTKPPTRRYY